MKKLTRQESDDLLLTRPYRYALDLANMMFPEYDIDPESGEEYQCFSHVGFDAFYAMQKNQYEFPFKKTAYDEEAEIQNELARLYIDPEAFWHALLMLHFLTQDKLNDAYTLGPTQKEMVESAIRTIDTEGSSIIVRKRNGRKAIIDDPTVIAFIKGCFEQSPFLQDDDESRFVDFKKKSTCSISEMMSYEAKELLHFFEVKSKPEMEKKGRRYRSPLLLISRLMFFTKMTRNENFLVSSESLKKVMRDYPNPGQRTIGRYTW